VNVDVFWPVLTGQQDPVEVLSDSEITQSTWLEWHSAIKFPETHLTFLSNSEKQIDRFFSKKYCGYRLKRNGKLSGILIFAGSDRAVNQYFTYVSIFTHLIVMMRKILANSISNDKHVLQNIMKNEFRSNFFEVNL